MIKHDEETTEGGGCDLIQVFVTPFAGEIEESRNVTVKLAEVRTGFLLNETL
jgi:hypothetical protein